MKIKRRQFLILGAASTGAVLASRWAVSQNSTTSPSTIASPQSQLYKSSNGLLELDLEASLRPVSLGNQQAYLMSYNGQVPGPRLEAKPRDTVRIHFTNNLEQPTNLHYHGLHVSPVGNADNALLSISAGERLTYEFPLPQNHPAGTFWYHPHHHGHVAEQVFGGLAGLLIVRGELDAIPEIQAAQEEFLVLQDFDLDVNGRINPPNHMARMMGREGSLVTVNGQRNPSLSIANKDRFLNRGLFYGAGVSEASMCRNQQVLVVGGGDSAGQAVTHFSQYAKQVTMIVRGSTLAATLSKYLIDRILDVANVEVLFNAQVTGLVGEGSLQQVEITDYSKNSVRTIDTQYLFICIGGVPNTEWAKDTNIVREE